MNEPRQVYRQLGYRLELPPEAQGLSEDEFWEWMSGQLSDDERQGIFDWWMRGRTEVSDGTGDSAGVGQ